MPDKAQILISMSCYIAVVVGIGLHYARRANESSENYLIEEERLGLGSPRWEQKPGYERMVVYGTSGCCLLVWLERRNMDRNRSFDWNLFKLVVCIKKTTWLYRNRERLYYDSGFFQQSL